MMHRFVPNFFNILHFNSYPQALARVWRPGQQKECFIYRLLCTGTIEEKIYQRQLTKNALSTRIVEQKKGNDGSNFSSSELRDLFRLRKDTLCDTHDLLGCRCSRSVRVLPNSRVSVDELTYWDHISDLKKFLDARVSEAGDGLISFIFSKRTDTKEMAVENEVKKEELFEEVRKDDVEMSTSSSERDEFD
jgi:DNA repair and recombination protein RAD54 and RAD54-like protein